MRITVCRAIEGGSKVLNNRGRLFAQAIHELGHVHDKNEGVRKMLRRDDGADNGACCHESPRSRRRSLAVELASREKSLSA
jgi:hypothetical protein